MDEDKVRSLVKMGLCGLGLGAVGSAVLIPGIGIWVAVAILLLAALLFGGYFLWQRAAARRRRENFTSAIEAQTAAAPKSITDPNKRAALDNLRQKFQKGMQEFRSRGKDIYKLPWFVIIGEPGSGKTETIRHSGIDFPPGLQDELQGSGGTVNMDWWFTNRGIILDTAGSMIFNETGAGEAPEWREFLRLLRKSRPHCPVNGLFLVLSVESLIKDSADRIAFKASRLAQQLDMIQRTLDVRFPVYLLVTKCDLLTGFREFFDGIDDPLLQHQIFGWSNPDALDSHFRPDLVDKHLATIAEKLRRRRMALLRESPGDTGRLGDTQRFFASSYQLGRGPAGNRRLDEMDSMFALPESIMRLAPRLRRYLETIFVAGEWSAKPVFLRGIYFTSSMREGKALDEAIAFATGLSLEQLPDDRTWERNRAFFLRDLFHEKVFRESGLVTRASNTLTLLRQRQLAIFGSAGVALLLLLVLAGFAYKNLKESVGREAALWRVAATNWNEQEWSPPIVRAGSSPTAPFIDASYETVPGLGQTRVVDFHKQLRAAVEKPLSVGWIFKPVSWIRRGRDEGRPAAQRTVFEGGVLRPLVARTREKMLRQDPRPGDAAALDRQRNALLALIQLETDALLESKNAFVGGTNLSSHYLQSFLAYLTETNTVPDTNLVRVFALNHDPNQGNKAGAWPPPGLLLGNSLASNAPINAGLERFQAASVFTRTNVDYELALLTNFTDALANYHEKELHWLADPVAPCTELGQAYQDVASKFNALVAVSSNTTGEPFISLARRYSDLHGAATKASALALRDPVRVIRRSLPESRQNSGLVLDIDVKLNQLASQAAAPVKASFDVRSDSVFLLDTNCIYRTNAFTPTAFEQRWNLYSNACALASLPANVEEVSIGDKWQRYVSLNQLAEKSLSAVTNYQGPLAIEASNACVRIAGEARRRIRSDYVDQYIDLIRRKLSQANRASWSAADITNTAALFSAIYSDYDNRQLLEGQQSKLAPVPKLVADQKQEMLRSIRSSLNSQLGFPVALNGSQVKPPAEVRGLGKRVEAISLALQDQVWRQDAADALAQTLKTAQTLTSVVNSLINQDGTGTEFDLFFLPPPAQNRGIINIFRKLEVTAEGPKFRIDELTRADPEDESTCKVGTLRLNNALVFTFREGITGGQEVVLAHDDWTLIRLIRDGKAIRSEDGKKYTFRLPLAKGEISGEAAFEARLQRPLPEKAQWPTEN